MAASVELHSPARETHTGACLLNEISDNLVGHRRKSATTKRPLIGRPNRRNAAGMTRLATATTSFPCAQSFRVAHC